MCNNSNFFEAYTEQFIILSYAAVAYYLCHRYALAKPLDPINGSHFGNGLGRHGGAAGSHGQPSWSAVGGQRSKKGRDDYLEKLILTVAVCLAGFT